MTSFFVPVLDQIHQVEDLIRAQAEGYHPDLQAALEHLLKSGGKRIRPTLTLLVGRMLGAPEPQLITLAASIELLHTATLVHDDLIDGALLRRGIPTLNARWSPGATVLTGDFLFARAAKLAAETNSIPVMRLFAETLTIIVNGEISQMFNPPCISTLENYYQRIYAKTASLFEASTGCAAMISTTDNDLIMRLRHFGRELGMAFQIIDDILDLTGDETQLGKPIGSDLRQGIITLPVIRFLHTHPEDPFSQMILQGKCLQNDADILAFIERLRHSDAIEDAHQEAQQFIKNALNDLRTLPSSPEQQYLEELTWFVTQRKT